MKERNCEIMELRSYNSSGEPHQLLSIVKEGKTRKKEPLPYFKHLCLKKEVGLQHSAALAALL